MKCDVVVDMQFGSTGKGQAVVKLATEREYEAAVRVQSIQAGHTIYYCGKPYKMRTIPCAWVDPDVKLILGAGCFIDKKLLLEEIAMVSEATGRDVRERLILDPRATYVLDSDVEAEKGLDGQIGSTAHGAGASLIRKLWRREPPSRVCDDDWALNNGLMVEDTVLMLDGMRGDALLEGCQGAMLSVHTSPYYPYVTSRECSAAGVLSEAGIPPSRVRDVVGVFRTLPIRVGGNSGPTGAEEITWDEVNRRAGRTVEPERTTVTNRVRRIFEFSHQDFALAMAINGPTMLMMTFADYLVEGIYGATDWEGMPIGSATKVRRFMDEVEERHGVPIRWISTGELPENVF